MSEHVTGRRSIGLLRLHGWVYAACVSLVGPALGQDPEGGIAFDPPPSSALEESAFLPAVTPPTAAAPIPATGTGSDDGAIDGAVNVSPYLTVDLHVEDTDLAKVLQMLSIQSQKNIIVSTGVSARVTANLYDVTFYEALDAILNANGYGYIEEGSFIKVYTLEEIKQIEDAQRKMMHRRFELNYINAADAAIFVTPLLSDSGTIAINGEVPAGMQPDESNNGAESWSFSSTMVVVDFADNLEEIARMIEELDTRPQQVLVEAQVLQTTLNEDNAWGVDWNLVADADFLDLTNPLSAVDDLIGGSASEGGFQPADNDAFGIGTNVGRVAQSGGLKIGVVSNDISVFLRVLDEVGVTTIISKPRILTLNRQRGDILIGRRIGYLSSTSTETSTTQTVQFLNTGTQLLFRPFIARDGFIRMELKPSVSEGIIRDVTGSTGDPFTIPDQVTQELTTNVVVRDGYTIVLGGLFKEETTANRRQVPVLGEIPVIGYAFRGMDDLTRRSEITFLITPTIMKDEYAFAEGAAASEMVDRTRIAARQGLLGWSNDKLTNMHNLKAQEYMRTGDEEMALWEIRRSLTLNPNQPLVRRMQEQITGESEKYFNGATFERILDDVVSKQLDSASVQTEPGNTPVTSGQATDLLLDTLQIPASTTPVFDTTTIGGGADTTPTGGGATTGDSTPAEFDNEFDFTGEFMDWSDQPAKFDPDFDDSGATEPGVEENFMNGPGGVTGTDTGNPAGNPDPSDAESFLPVTANDEQFNSGMSTGIVVMPMPIEPMKLGPTYVDQGLVAKWHRFQALLGIRQFSEFADAPTISDVR